MRLARYGRAARMFAEAAGWAWTRAERRRLARAGSEPGRRFAARVPKMRPPTTGLTRDVVATLALFAVPGLRPRDVQVRVPAPGSAIVEISGPLADAVAVEAVRAKLEDHTPMGIALDVVAVGCAAP